MPSGGKIWYAVSLYIRRGASIPAEFLCGRCDVCALRVAGYRLQGDTGENGGNDMQIRGAKQLRIELPIIAPV